MPAKGGASGGVDAAHARAFEPDQLIWWLTGIAQLSNSDTSERRLESFSDASLFR
jgi:hypothetical protein